MDFRAATVREPIEVSIGVEYLRFPACRLRCDLDLAEDGANVNRLAKVAVVVFPEFLHGRSFRERGGVANIIISSSPQHLKRAILDER